MFSNATWVILIISGIWNNNCDYLLRIFEMFKLETEKIRRSHLDTEAEKRKEDIRLQYTPLHSHLYELQVGILYAN